MYSYDIGIVIVNYNVRHFLVQCLQSISNTVTKNLRIEVWVVDNDSIDGSVQLLEKAYPHIHVIANKKNVGFSAANNQAIRQMSSKYVLLLNPDTILEEDTLQQCFDFMEAQSDVGAMGVKMIDGSGKFLPESKRQTPNLWNSFCKLTYLSDLFPKSKWFSGYNLGYLSEDESHEIEILCGAFMFIRAKVLDEVGLLDEAFFMYGEDIDLSYRIMQCGHKIYYYPHTRIIHYKGESTKKSSLNYVKTFYGAMFIYVEKHYQNAKLFSALLRYAIFLRSLLSVFNRIILQWLRPVIDVAIFFISLKAIKWAWALWYFKDAQYYENSNINQNLLIYAFTWVLSLRMGGHYDAVKFRFGPVISIFTGTFFILLIYALLPEHMRSSRAIIVLGTLSAIVSAYISTAIFWLFTSKKSSEMVSSTAIVATRANGQKLAEVLQKSKGFNGDIHFIHPQNETADVWYSASIDTLPALVKALKINEVIYSSEDLTMKDIIRSMTLLESKVSFKIGSDDSLSMIGSDSKHHQGSLINLDITYRLSKAEVLRHKRLLDLVVCLISITLLPIIFVLNAGKWNVFKNIVYVFVGKYTWVGYGGNPDDYTFLPNIQPAVVQYALATKILDYTADHFKQKNVEYAKNYAVTTDIKVIFSNIHKVGNRINDHVLD